MLSKRIAIVAAVLLLVGGSAALYLRSRERRCTAMLQGTLRDWPQFERYRTANEQLLAQPLAPAVVFLGDSITYLWSLQTFFPNHPYINRGIERQTSAQMLLRFQRDVLALHPRQVVIQAGTNDIEQQVGLDWIFDNLTSMAELAHQNRVQVIFLSVFPVYDTPRHKRTTYHSLADARRINQWLQSYADRNGDLYIDCFKELAEPGGTLNPAFSDDGLHPNAAGYKVISALVQSALTQTDGQPRQP